MKHLALIAAAATAYLFWRGGASTSNVTGSIASGWAATRADLVGLLAPAGPAPVGTASPAAPCLCAETSGMTFGASSSSSGCGCGGASGAKPAAGSATAPAPIILGGN
jgi:hypothetical protein